MKITMKLLALCMCGAVLSGCVAPGHPQSQRSIQWIDPEPDGYYTGEQPDFANRFNPDPKGRKFRVAYLRLHLESIDGNMDGAAIKAAAGKGMSATYGIYMRFREQAMANRQTQNAQGSTDLENSFRTTVKSNYAFEKAKIGFHRAAADVVAAGGWDIDGGVFGEPTPREFAEHWDDVEFLNAELASRYSALFTTDESGFPLDIAMIGLYTKSDCTKSDPVVRTRFEAWCIGLPEHANVRLQHVFSTSEVFLDPYDSIAAAVFKLTDEQFEGLEPANPKDHEWLEEK